MISFHVDDQPCGQPRARARYGKGPKGVYNPPGPAREWRKIVEIAAKPHRPSKPLGGAVYLSLLFAFKRPKSHYRTGRFAHLLKKSAPEDHIQKPDLDNLEKLVMDCLKRVQFYRDDSQINKKKTKKQWTEMSPGVWVHVKGN